jgi:NitT/TauT family transport system ATP-binding protein
MPALIADIDIAAAVIAEAPPAAPILRIEAVHKRFSASGREVEALRAVDLDVAPGEFVCIIGASGCGKSTLLRLVGGFDRPTDGRIMMLGRPVSGPGPDRGMVFQDYGLFPWLTVRRNVEFGPASRGVPRAEVSRIGERFIEMIGLTRFAGAYPHELSGGMKQRVAIARVLANEAAVVLMDEPFGALDAMTRERLQIELLSLWEGAGLTVMFITHAIEEAILLADRIVVMSPNPGRISAIHRVELPRPRDVSSPGFNALRRELGAMLHGKED